jgi:hypothetical protein
MWIAPNLVTLLGFFFIIGNVVLLEVYIPDLVGPVSPPYTFALGQGTHIIRRRLHGYTTASRLVCGCTPPWTTSTESKRAVPELRVRLESSLSMCCEPNAPERD